jgi:hypothetical protein
MRYAHNNKPPKVETAASADKTRPALTAVWYDTDTAELRATDSYIAVRVPVEVGTGEESGWVSPEALKASRKRDSGGLRCSGAVEVMPSYWDGDADGPALVTFAREDYGQAPKLPQLWPAHDGLFTVGLNAGFLKRLADALGAEDSVVTLTFQGTLEGSAEEPTKLNPLRPIIVRPNKGYTAREDMPGAVNRPEGLLMPVRVS